MFRLQFYPFVIIIALLSCNTPPADSTQASIVIPEEDSLVRELSPELKELLTHFKPAGELPINIDSLYIAGISEFDSLGTMQVRMLDKNWKEHDLSNGIPYHLEEFYQIDSMQTSGDIEDYLAQADIGMTVSSTIYALHKLKFPDGTEMLTWAYSFSSYPACPYSSGTSIFYSLMYDGEITESFLLGQDYGAGDPPVSMEIKMNASVSEEGKIIILYKRISDDMDQPEMELEERNYVLTVKSGKSEILSENANTSTVQKPSE